MTNQNKISIYYPLDLFDEKQRGFWFELIKSKERLSRKESKKDEIIQDRLDWSEDGNKADVWVLPMDWAYYFNKNIQHKAIQFCKEAHEKGKIVLSVTGGDRGITLDLPSNTIVYRQSGYRSTMRKNERTAPFFLSGPISLGFIKSDDDLYVNKTNDSRLVGFCGMAPHGLKVELLERLKIMMRNAKNKKNKSPEDKQAVLSSSNLRYKMLQIFKKDARFKANYIIREKYRGGVQTEENRKKTTLEYYNNQIESDLILCVRGLGNFSLRFYETLAMGRIPIFVDTDSPLPSIGDKNWHDYIIWVDEKEIKNAPEIANKWLEGRDLVKQLKTNRELWKAHFRLDNFWLNELESIEKQYIAK